MSEKYSAQTIAKVTGNPYHNLFYKVAGLPVLIWIQIITAVIAVVIVVVLFVLAIIVAVDWGNIQDETFVIPYRLVDAIGPNAWIPNPTSGVIAHGAAELHADGTVFDGEINFSGLSSGDVIETAHLQVGNRQSFSKIVKPIRLTLNPKTGLYQGKFRWTDHDELYILSNEAKDAITANNLYFEIITRNHPDGIIKGKFTHVDV